MIGHRIRRARLAAGLSLDDLASKLERPITKQALSKYERGASQPSALMVVELAQALGVKPSRLLSDPDVSVRWVGYRRHASLSKGRMEAIAAAAEQRLVGEMELRGMFNVATTSDLPAPTPVNTADDIEYAAENLRQHWGLGHASVNGLIETMEEHGSVVMSWAEVNGFDGLCGWANEEIPIIVINANREPDRIRFDAAHELGHLLLDVKNPSLDEERVMHRFAGSLLVPKQAAYRELGTRRHNLSFAELGLCKQRWGLSMQGWAHRAHDLDIVDDSVYKKIFTEFSRRNWRRREPYRLEAVEEPILVRRLLWRALTERLITASDAHELLPSYEQEEEASLDDDRPSLIDLAKMSLEDRHAILERASIEVDDEDIALWDAIGCDVPTEEDQPDGSEPASW